MKKFTAPFVFLIAFLILTFCVKNVPYVTFLDKTLELHIQSALSFIPLKYPVFADKTGYLIMIFSGLIAMSIYFIKNKNFINLGYFLSVPVVTYFINHFLKLIIQRPRPDLYLQISWIHPHSLSYTSRHTLITFCLFSIIIWFIYKKMSNKNLKYLGITFCIFWIFMTGLSRIWIGVHYPTDVIGACILGMVITTLYIEIFKKNNEKTL